MAMNTTAAKKVIAKEQIQDLLTKEIRPKEKWEICSDCKIEVIDMAGHEDVLHKRKFKKFNHDGVRLLIHCPLGLPDPKLFLAKQHLLDHINDVYA